MRKVKWYRYVFADGYKILCRGFSREELAAERRKHGKLISKTYDGSY